jgi:hypothetical protein
LHGFLLIYFFEVSDLPPGRAASQGREACCRRDRDLVIALPQAAAAIQRGGLSGVICGELTGWADDDRTY